MARTPELWEAVTPLIVTVMIIAAGVFFGGGDVPIPILLMLASVTPAALAIRLGLRWQDVEEGMLDGMRISLQATIILLVVGTTIGAWAMSGTIASLVSYGLLVLRPSYFLAATCVITSIVSLAIGSSWTTAATVGVALMGIGEAIGVPAPMTAGAILSGSYFGDKMSPLSDTTNLAPAVAGSTLFDHIQAMLYTTLPAWIIAVLLYGLLGLTVGGGGGFSAQGITALREALSHNQVISPIHFGPPLLVIALALLRVPAIPALLTATLAGLLLAVFQQGAGLIEALTVLYTGFSSHSGDTVVDDLLSRGGMSSMFDTVAIILTATAFGGVMERAGFMEVLLQALLKRVHTASGLITATIASAVGTNFLLAEQYLAIVLPGRMYRDTYPRFGLHPKMLSRSIEDGGTVTSALCPWNSGGAFMASTLGVATFSYAPYAFLNLLVPIIAIVYAWTGLFIFRSEEPTASGSNPPADGGGPKPA